MPWPVAYLEAQKWLDRLTDDAKKQLGLSDAYLADLLLRRGLSFYLKSLARQALEDKR